MENREKAEMKKEGKKVDDDKPKKKVNLAQFLTSDEIAKAEKEAKEAEKEVSYKPFSIPKS